MKVLKPKIFLQLMKKDWKQNSYAVVFLLLLLSFILIYFTNLTSVNVIFIIFIFSQLYWNFNGKFSIYLSLLLAVAILVILVTNYVYPTKDLRNWTDEIAVWVYLFFVTGFIKILITSDNKEITLDEDGLQNLVPSYLLHPNVQSKIIKKQELINKFVIDKNLPLPKKKI